jgi:hypothetical protein
VCGRGPHLCELVGACSKGYNYLALAPTGVLFANAFFGDHEETVALDASNLAVLFRFGEPIFKRTLDSRPSGICVIGDEVFIGGEEDRTLHVFSLTGEHIREMRGDWREPAELVHHEGRLFLLECPQYEDAEASAADSSNAGGNAISKAPGKPGCRVIVLTPEGKTLQVWEDERLLLGMFVWRQRLMVLAASLTGRRRASYTLMSLVGI